VFYVPPTARWEYLQYERAKLPTIGKDLDDAMDAIEKDNPNLKGVLPKDYARPALDKKRLGELIDLIGNIGFNEPGQNSKDLLGRVYEYFLGMFADAEGKRGGQFYTPESIVKLLIRITDKCVAINSEELTDLAAEKNAFQWELIVAQKITLKMADAVQVEYFLSKIRTSDKVSDFIKDKQDIEILEYYQFIAPESFLTNLGVLWLGTSAQRARLCYPITFQYIVYNERDEKVRKKDWHFHQYNPMQLLLEIEKEAIELTYSTELSNGLFRETIRKYPKEVIRELLINAIAHKRYTTSGDIFLEVYPDRVVFTNPGGLPLGVTKNNILHERQRRNPHLIQVLHDLKLMEGEGSGYDLVYEKLSLDAKPFPEIESSFNKMIVTVQSTVMDEESLSVIDYVNKHFTLNQKETITLGVITTRKKLLSTQLTHELQLNQEDKLKYWLGSLLDKNILISRGAKKGTEYLLNPDLFSQAKLNLTPSLKTIEPYKLEAMIIEDLKYNGESKMKEIQNRMAEVYPSDIQKSVYRMVEKGELVTLGANRNRKYFIPKKNK
jgi:ATP-dependent DNA helicase RecG